MRNSKGFAPILILLIVLTLGGVGFFAYKSGQLNPKIVTPSPTLTSTQKTPTPTSDPTANWRQINKFHWSFKVPATWKYLACNNDLVFVGLDIQVDSTQSCAFDSFPGYISISRSASPDYEIPTQAKNGLSLLYPEVSEVKNILVDGNAAIYQRQTIKDGQGVGTYIYVYIKHDQFLDIIILDDLSQRETFDQFLTTFKYVDQKVLLNTTDWKTYPPATITGLNYSFKYPPNIVLKEAEDLSYFNNGNGTLYHRYLGKQTDLDAAITNFKPWGTNEQVVFANNKELVNIGIFSGYKLTSADNNNSFLFLKTNKLNGILVFHYPTVEAKSKSLLDQIVQTITIVE